MYKFGKTPPRSLTAPGVAGLLGADCSVFYSALFSTRHVGRVSDLISARLREQGVDELRLRAVVLYSAFEAFRAQSPRASGEPLNVECGLDAEKVALAVSFVINEAFDGNVAELVTRVKAGDPANEFETMLGFLHAHANRLVLKWRAADRRIEIVGVIGLQGRMEDLALAEPSEMDWVELDAPGAAEPPVKSYVELGDLDYPALLRDDAAARAGVEPVKTGQFLAAAARESTALEEAIRAKAHPSDEEDATRVEGVTEKRDDEVTQVAGKPDPRLESTRVGGQEREKTQVTQIAGIGPHQKQKGILIQGDAPEVRERLELKGGDASEPVQAQAQAHAQAQVQSRAYVEKIQELQGRIAELEQQRAQVRPVLEADASASEASGEAGAEPGAAGIDLKEILSRIWPFRKSRNAAADDQKEPAAETVAEAASQAVPAVIEEPISAAAPAKEIEGAVNAEQVSKTLMAELQAGGFDRALAKAQKGLSDLQREQPKSKRYVDGLMGELLQERSRLAELAKKVTVAVRQKELEFRNKEHAYQEEVRRREDVIKQKSFALNRAKDQLAQANMSLERMKSASASAADDAHFKQKFNHVQKLLLSSKEENSALQSKIEEMRGALSAAQFAAKAKGPTPKELAEMKAKADKAQRQADEYKRANLLLQERVEDQKKDFERALTAAKEAGSKGPSAEDVKKRLEAAMKMITAHRKEAERLSLRVDELEREEQRLRRELESATGIKGKAGSAKPGAGGGSKPGAAA